MGQARYICPACHEQGLSLRSRYFSGMLWKGECQLCQAKVRPHVGWTTLHAITANILMLGAIVVLVFVVPPGVVSGGLALLILGLILVAVMAAFSLVPITALKRKG